jgi:lactate dehydrogenase-like 2-hydroxyacid dehydrogenase
MQRDAILVNTSRGPVVDTPALIEVFKREQQGQIGADAQHSMPQAKGSV